MAATVRRPLSAALPRLSSRTTRNRPQQQPERVLNPSESSVVHMDKPEGTVAHTNPSWRQPLLTAELGFLGDDASRRGAERADSTSESNPDELDDEGERRTPVKVYGW